LTRDQEPKEAEMQSMSEYVSKLEEHADLEVSIIRATKINKVLKAILKLPSIPKEEEFNFKTRSQSLLDKWVKILASDQGETGTTAAATNGTATEPKGESEDAKPSPTEVTNGTKESSAEEKPEEKADDEKPPAAEDSKDAPAEPEEVPALTTEDPAKESTTEPTPIESSA